MSTQTPRISTPRRSQKHSARRAIAAALTLGLALALGSVAPQPASAGMSAEDILKDLKKRAKRNAKIAHLDEATQKKVWKEYKRLGKDHGDFVKAIENITSAQGGTNPFGPSAFGDTVYPLLRDNCRECHSGSGPGFPSFAHKTVSVAYDEVIDNGKARLSDPGASRLVERLAEDRHECWGDCDENAAKMALEIAQWADAEESSGGGVNVAAISSQARRMKDGKRDKGKARADGNVIARWDFSEGEGEIAFDSSGVKPELNLTLTDTEWVEGFGIQFVTKGMALGSKRGSKKLFREIAHPQEGTQQFSVEVWVESANTDQDGPARIVTYSDGDQRRNFTLAQNLYNVIFRNRNKHKKTDKNGMPELATRDEDRDFQAALQHIVLTYDQYRGRKIYVNGKGTGDKDPVKPQWLWNWDPSFKLALGNETTNDRPWQGKIRFAAIHKVALTGSEINKNYKAGVGERFRIQFGLDQWFPTQNSAVEMDVSEFDNTSYLFCNPKFVGSEPLNIRVRDMEIAVNGEISPTGQAFMNVDKIVSKSGSKLSRLCSIIPKLNGVKTDRFAVTFGLLGQYENVQVEQNPPGPDPVDLEENFPEIGIRDFARLNATMSTVTRVPATNNEVEETYQGLTQQLPASSDARSFLSANQVGVAKLALSYCDQMVSNTGIRDTFFASAPGFDFGAAPSVAFASDTEKNEISDALYDQMIGTGLADQPTRAEIRSALSSLIDTLTTSCEPTCEVDRTETIVKATCAAVLSSAPMVIN